MKYYIIAGEASGDLHASNLIKAIKKKDNQAVFRGWGGDLMQIEGLELIKHYKEHAYMGFYEVAKNLKSIFKNLKSCREDILNFKPDALILVDYPGFNLRIAQFAKKANFKVFYYISPQVWAWKKGRVHKIKKIVDKMFVILPFETAFYEQFNFKVDFVGHPLLDAIENFQSKDVAVFLANNQLSQEKPIIAVLPGSRPQEIKKMLPIMLSVIPNFENYQFVVAGVNSVPSDFYKEIIQNDKVKIIFGQTYSLLQAAKAAMVTSGTATLETALFRVPQVVCYKGSPISYWIAKKLVTIKYIALVNLIMDKLVVKELIQNELNKKNLIKELDKILNNEKIKQEIQNDYQELVVKLGKQGASDRTANLITEYLVSEHHPLKSVN